MGTLSVTHRIQSDRSGDQICIFGFSRGAYTARALASMVQKIGLLPTSGLDRFPFAFATHNGHDEGGPDPSRRSSIKIRIKFVGVWLVTFGPADCSFPESLVGTLSDLLDLFQRIFYPVVQTTPLRTSAMRWLSMNAASSLPLPSTSNTILILRLATLTSGQSTPKRCSLWVPTVVCADSPPRIWLAPYKWPLRYRRWFRAVLHASQPRSHHPSMDGQGMF